MLKTVTNQCDLVISLKKKKGHLVIIIFKQKREQKHHVINQDIPSTNSHL